MKFTNCKLNTYIKRLPLNNYSNAYVFLFVDSIDFEIFKKAKK